MILQGKTVLVIGLGRSGIAAARLCLAKGARVTGTDAAPRERLPSEALALESEGAAIVAGGHPASLFDGTDLVVISPGVPSFAALEAFEKAGGEVIGELELAARFFEGTPIALIGGTNGKSTTTALVHAMLEASGKKAFIGGNFGTPLAEVVGQSFDVIVLEISSFQAERVPTLHARVHVLLNITEDHLDRYPSFEAYANAKGNPFVHMEMDDLAVISAGDKLLRRQAERGDARIVTFNSHSKSADVYGDIEAGAIVDNTRGARYPLSLLRIQGLHNIANACAAIAAASGLGATEEGIRRALASFEGLGHRNVLVGEVDGVRYYDDSKGTNVGAAFAALMGLLEPKAVLIAGGRDKLGSYDLLVQGLRVKGRALVLIGEAAARIADAARGALPIERAASMADAVAAARRLAQPGDAVLLSPACSSFDMFRDYKDRGDQFARAVQAMMGVGAEGAEGRPGAPSVERKVQS